MIGAEPIPASLLSRFAEAFAPAGFRANAFFPVYGLAEATVAVTFPTLLASTVFDRIHRSDLEHQSRAVPAAEPEASFVFVGVGKPIPGTAIKIAAADGKNLPDRSIGEICVRSDTLALGYYDEDGSIFRDGWLHTGDLGYVADGTLFITGRKKEMIIKGGQNLIPSVLEEIVAEVPGIRTGAVAAVGVHSERLATELVCVVAETRGSSGDARIAHDVRQALKAAGVVVDRVLLVPPKSLPKTTSGKLQRGAIAQLVAEQMMSAVQ
jgi:acyl-CoA synthetase (AMP-forming)/AMP-acid ligase II